MVNWIAFVLEIIGFSLMITEKYFPDAASRLENYIDEKCSSQAIRVLVVRGAIILCISSFALVGIMLSEKGGNETIVGILIFITLGLAVFAEKVLGFKTSYWDSFNVFLTLPLRLLMKLSNFIDRDGKATGGVGIILGSVGLTIDASQAIFH